MAARKPWQRQIEQSDIVLIHQTAALFESEEVLAIEFDGRPVPVGDRRDHIDRNPLALLADDERHAGLDDPRLFRGDEFDPIAEEGLVVERHRRDDRNGRAFQDIGRVETPAKTNLDHRDIGRVFRKQEKGHRGQHFEDGDRIVAIGSRGPDHRIGQDVVGDKAARFAEAAQPVALMPRDQMGRGVNMDRSAVGFKDRAAEGGNRPFAIGSRHMDDGRQALLRIAELGKQLPDSIEREIIALRMTGKEPLDFHGGEGSGRHILTTYASRMAFAKRRRR